MEILGDSPSSSSSDVVGGSPWPWATAVALLFILFFHWTRRFLLSSSFGLFRRSSPISLPPPSSSLASLPRVSEIVSDDDLKFLIENLDERQNEDEKWENVTERRNNSIYYSAKCCRPQNGPLKYLSVTVFENCSPELLRDFYMDNDYRKLWDSTIVSHEQLQLDKNTGLEIGRTVKKFTFLKAREYILAWRLWEGSDGSFYCFTKECEHPSAPPQQKFVRVGCFRSGWQIRKVPGSNSSEIRMFHQEDAGLNPDMAKLAFSKGIWSYVCKMDAAFRKYASSMNRPPQQALVDTALTLISKVPLGLEMKNRVGETSSSSSSGTAAPYLVGQGSNEARKKKLLRRPSKKAVANGVLLLGGVLCLTRGHPTLGAKVAMAYILTKLNKRGASPSNHQPLLQQ